MGHNNKAMYLILLTVKTTPHVHKSTVDKIAGVIDERGGNPSHDHRACDDDCAVPSEMGTHGVRAWCERRWSGVRSGPLYMRTRAKSAPHG
jgi:hypothetical protein